MSKEAMKLAHDYANAKATWYVESLYGTSKSYTTEKEREMEAAHTALREALAQERSSDEQPAQQEPVAFLDWYDNAHWGNEDFKDGCWRAWDAALEHTSPQPAQHDPVAWEGKTKLGFPIGAHRIIFSDKVRADEWMSGFVDGHAWLEPLTYTSPPTLSLAQRQARSADTWVGLTDEERGHAINANFGTGLWSMAKDIEAKLKEKNCG